MKKTLIPVILAGALLGACDQTGLQINSVNGTVNISDIFFTGCVYSSGAGKDVKSIVNINGTEINIKNYDYASTDASCSTGEIFDDEITIVMTNEGDVQTSWLSGIVPNRQDNGQPLPDPATATRLSLKYTKIVNGATTISHSVGDMVKDIWFVDDTSSDLHLYDGYNGTNPAGGTDNGFPILLTAN